MPGTSDDPKPAAPAPDREAPKNAVEPDNLGAKISRLNKETEQLGEAMRQKPKKT